jgi:serine/threonine-protein kinase
MSPPLSPGQIIAHRYRILACIGSGGMSEVYAAEHMPLGTRVAFKRLPPDRARGDHGLRFDREARAAARLSHPGCVQVLDVGRCLDGGRFLVMELLEGPTLRQRLRESGAFAPARAIRVVCELLAALAHAHSLNVLHRDVKPENAMFARRAGGERVVLIDFGLARLLEEPSVTGMGVCVGSPSYVAPERLLEQPYDETADVYSVGVVLYELLTGVRPITGADRAEIMRGHIRVAPCPPHQLHAGVPLALSAIAMRALSKQPERRFRSAEAMLSALTDVAVYADGAQPAPVGAADDEPTSRLLDARSDDAGWLRRAWHGVRFGAWRWRGAEEGSLL